MRAVPLRAVEAVVATSRVVLPLRLRFAVAIWLGRRRWGRQRHWISIGLLGDFAKRDPSAFHRFLWSNHLAYAGTYEVARKFGPAGIPKARRILFDDLRRYLISLGISPGIDVRSVLEVGCSLGYLLQYVETDLFQSATTLEGIDVDSYAIQQGSAYLAGIGSNVRIQVADMGALASILAGRSFDVILCLGTLMYLRPEDARTVVRTILDHASMVAAFSGPAHPVQDNGTLAASAIRERDATFMHDLDGMVRDAGASVGWRRWEGPLEVDGKTVYYVFARPPTAA